LILCIKIDNFIFYSFTKFWVTLGDTSVVELVDQFRYLGSIITEDGETDVDVAALINSVHFVFYQLKSIWSTTKFFRSLHSYMDLKHRRSPTPSSQGCRCFSTDIYQAQDCDQLTLRLACRNKRIASVTHWTKQSG
jgi:hypothetical protein